MESLNNNAYNTDRVRGVLDANADMLKSLLGSNGILLVELLLKKLG